MNTKIIFICVLLCISTSKTDGWPQDTQKKAENIPTDDESLDDMDISKKEGLPIPDCEPYEPTMPNFTRPDRRMTQVKCMEIIWDIKKRRDVKEKEDNCFKAYQAKSGVKWVGPVRPIDPNLGKYPHMVAIGWRKAGEGERYGAVIFKCGATLISNDFVLTAGHCTRLPRRDKTVLDPVPKVVKFGERDIDYGGIQVSIINIYPHRKYKPSKLYHDIALMQLEVGMLSTYTIHPACIWSSRSRVRLQRATETNMAMTIGWGVVIERGNYTKPLELKVEELDIISQNRCSTLLKNRCNRSWCGLKKHQICAGRLDTGVDSVEGNAGTPIQMKLMSPKVYDERMYYVIGVASFGFGPAKPNTPGVFTRVSSYLDWIEQVVWGVNPDIDFRIHK